MAYKKSDPRHVMNAEVGGLSVTIKDKMATPTRRPKRVKKMATPTSRPKMVLGKFVSE